MMYDKKKENKNFIFILFVSEQARLFNHWVLRVVNVASFDLAELPLLEIPRNCQNAADDYLIWILNLHLQKENQSLFSCFVNFMKLNHSGFRAWSPWEL